MIEPAIETDVKRPVLRPSRRRWAGLAAPSNSFFISSGVFLILGIRSQQGLPPRAPEVNVNELDGVHASDTRLKGGTARPSP
jgi:hypothetical protein